MKYKFKAGDEVFVSRSGVLVTIEKRDLSYLHGVGYYITEEDAKFFHVERWFREDELQSIEEYTGTKPKDMKTALNSGEKPDTTHIRGPFRVHASRAHEFGNAKYERANCYREAPEGVSDVERLRGYIRACMDHCQAALDAIEAWQANDPTLEDLEGVREACYAPDEDSGLPHIAHAGASLNIAITQAVNCGLLPKDPGQPWRDK